jgi:hypothetical protein
MSVEVANLCELERGTEYAILCLKMRKFESGTDVSDWPVLASGGDQLAGN